MRTPAAIAVIAAGAILSLAVSARVPGVNLRLAGVIIIVAGIAIAMAPPSAAAGWLRRRRGLADPAGLSPAARTLAEPDDDYPAYLLQDPAVLAAEVLNGIRSDDWPDPASASSPASAPPPARAPRAGERPGGRPAGPRALHSVDLGHAGDLTRRNGFG
jgi:hypothetical protein